MILNEDGILEPSDTPYLRIYMTYIVQNYDNPRFIIEGNVKKLESLHVGNEYIWSARNFIKQISSGNDICPPAGTIFKCLEIGLVNGNLSAIMYNSTYGKCIGDLNQIKGQIFCFHNYKDYKVWINSYGKAMAKRILEGDVTIGMTKKMVQSSWGYPSKINSFSVGKVTKEQWVYTRSNRYLYFTGNKLTAIQDM